MNISKEPSKDSSGTYQYARYDPLGKEDRLARQADLARNNPDARCMGCGAGWDRGLLTPVINGCLAGYECQSCLYQDSLRKL